jgi:carnitine monooxygenase subunit
MLERFGFDSWHVPAQRSLVGANWKLAFDAHLDSYHLPVLHRNTFGPDVS